MTNEGKPDNPTSGRDDSLEELLWILAQWAASLGKDSFTFSYAKRGSTLSGSVNE